MRYLVVIMLLAGLTALPIAQAPSGANPRFEVASVKVNASGDPGGGTRPLPERFEATNASLTVLVMTAYNVRDFQVTGGPAWTATERFDVRASAGRTVPLAEMRGMVQSLLTERFKLVSHRQTREVRGWKLMLARSDGKLGPSLRRCAADCKGADLFQPGKWSEHGSPISSIASMLSTRLRAPVADRTGLEGQFAIDLEWSIPDGQADAPGAAAQALVTAVREQLGLKLEADRVPVDVLVIDSVERPTPD